ncbi:MAG: hypothetical protein AAFV72_22130 [Cyanobacteria bacterium J06635_1]
MATAILFGASAPPAWAEGSAQIGLNQPLYEYGVSGGLLSDQNQALYVDVISAGEVINISACGNFSGDPLRIQIFQTTPNIGDSTLKPATSTQVVNQSLSAENVSCTSSLASPLTNPLRYTAPSAGTYEIRITNEWPDDVILRRVDVTVTPNTSTNPDPTTRQGRLYSYGWRYNTGGYSEALSADTDYYIKVPGGRFGENFVWLLDLNNFAGFVYEIIANNIGVNAPNSGLSVPFVGNSIEPLYPIYLSYPSVVGARPTLPPNANGFKFTDNVGIDNTISPGASTGVQDSGFFTFTTDIDGTYSIVVDINNDGLFAPGDVTLLGTAINGSNSVAWDGKDNNGNVLPVGNYNAQLQIRIGEFHFVAGDAETSGGSQPGLTVFEALSQSITQDTLVYWDDFTLLGGTSTLPNGALSSTSAAKHTWGDFSQFSFGNENYLDTYVYGDLTITSTQAIIADNDIPVANNPDVLLVKRVTAINGQTSNPNDSHDLTQIVNDGVSGSADDASNWPNNYLMGELDAGLVKPGDEIEYTVYFLNAGSGDAMDVRICDWIQPNQRFVTGLYGGNDIELQLGEGAGSTTYTLTSASDATTVDRAELTTVGTLPVGPTCNLPSGATDPNAEVLVLDLTGASSDPTGLTTLPGTTGQGAPDSAFGFFRFTTRVDP